MFFVIWGLYRWEEMASKSWKVISEGVYEHSEGYIFGYNHRLGMIERVDKKFRIPITRVYLDDGRSFLLKDHHELPNTGTPIRILKNKLGSYKVETIST